MLQGVDSRAATLLSNSVEVNFWTFTIMIGSSTRQSTCPQCVHNQICFNDSCSFLKPWIVPLAGTYFQSPGIVSFTCFGICLSLSPYQWYSQLPSNFFSVCDSVEHNLSFSNCCCLLLLRLPAVSRQSCYVVKSLQLEAMLKHLCLGQSLKNHIPASTVFRSCKCLV